MNVEVYIASGILEAYVQGQLSADEQAEVEKNIMSSEGDKYTILLSGIDCPELTQA